MNRTPHHVSQFCQTILVQKLGETQLGAIVDRVGRQTLFCAAGACAIGFLVQLWALRPSPSSSLLPSDQRPPVFSELPTDALISHLWYWIVFGLLWFALNVVRIYELHRERARKVRMTVRELQISNFDIIKF